MPMRTQRGGGLGLAALLRTRWVGRIRNDRSLDVGGRAAKDDAAMRIVLAATLRAASNCIDVGAHKGAVLASMARLAPQGRHLAFEPIPALAARLRESFPSVDVREMALADRSGRSSFTVVANDQGYSGLRPRSYPFDAVTEDIQVDVGRLDDCVPDGYVPTLIKIDVEGGEAGVLRGGFGTISTHRPTILFEHGVGAAEHYGTTPGEVFKLLDECCLRIFDSDGLGPYSETDFVASFDRPMWNWIAAPADP